MIFLWIFVLIFSQAPASFAADQIVLPAISMSENEAAPSNFASASAEKIAKVGPALTEGGNYSGMTLPYILSYAKPISYPRWAAKEGRQGKAILAIEVLASGKVGRYRVVKSTGSKMLDKAAIQAIQTWEFHPAMKEGKPVRTCIEIPVEFTLNN